MDLPCQPWFLISLRGDLPGVSYIIDAFGDVGSDCLCLLLYVYFLGCMWPPA